MQTPGIFGILAYSESFHNCIQMHMQNPAIFTKIVNPSNLGNSESWYTENPGIFKTLKYLKPGTYSEPSKKFKVECFAKNS